MKTVHFENSFTAWREAARELLERGIPPEMLVWESTVDHQGSLLETLRDDDLPARKRRQLAVDRPKVPRRFMVVANRVAQHEDPLRWALLYRVLWRMTHGEPRLMDASVDEDVAQIWQMDREVRRARQDASSFVPDTRDLDELRRAVRACAGCSLCAQANGPVFGEGASDATIMLVGEQPGGCDDHHGRSFDDSANKLLRRALADVGCELDDCYATHALKAFKHDDLGDRRVSKRPDAYEIETCKPWLLAEIEAVEPTVIVAFGAASAYAVTGQRVAIVSERGEHQTPLAATCIVTLRPAAILRMPDQAGRQRRYEQLVGDLELAVRRARELN